MEQKNLLLAIVLSVAIMLGWQLYIAETTPTPAEQAGQTAPSQDAPFAGEKLTPPTALHSTDPTIPQLGAVPAQPKAAIKQVLEPTPRVKIDSSRITGSISLVGALFHDLTLEGYRETIEPTSEKVTLLRPLGLDNSYYAYFGWRANDNTEVPAFDANWATDHRELTPDTPMTLNWRNESGVLFQQVISLDNNYMFTVKQRVINNSNKPINVTPFGRIVRRGTPDVLDFYILHFSIFHFR